MNAWKGTSMSDMYKGHGPWNFEVAHISASKHHTILYEISESNSALKPHYNAQTHHWDNGYVRMPYSPKNVFPSRDIDGRDIIKSRWELIQETLLQPIKSSRELEAAINSFTSKQMKFLALHYLFEDIFSTDETEYFFETILPGIIQLALQLPDILPGSIPLLKTEVCKSISFSQLQVGSLLANGFLCTFPWRKDIASSYPGPNFASLFSAHLRPDFDNCVVEKLKCIIHYFRRVLASSPVGVISFERKYFRRNNVPRWDRLDNNLGNTRMHIDSIGTIEDNGLGLLQVDFANKFLGGGVLSFGSVQEEIRFVICPELIISRLFTEKLGPTEALIITGVERFSKYSGYGETFKWAGDFKDETPFDVNRRRQTTISAIDATHFHKSTDQFNSSFILRELNKAFSGFHSRDNVSLAPVATGNWGCGAFRGDPHLKYLIQLMACSAAKRDMVYYTFGNDDLKDTIYNMYTFIATNRVTICDLWRLLCRFLQAQLPSNSFYPYIQQAFFDTKKQPSISTFLNQNEPSTSAETEIAVESSPIINNSGESKLLTQPETNEDKLESSNICIEIDIVEASPDIIETSQTDTKVSVIHKHFEPVKREKQQSDLINLINIIDGQDTIVKKTDDTDSGSLLNCIDDFSKKRKEQGSISPIVADIENENIGFIEPKDEMDVEDIIENLTSENTVKECSRPVFRNSAKRKITDYFGTIRN